MERTHAKDARPIKDRADGAEAPPRESRVERSRCPFCREDVLSTQDVAACEACLARHHSACWSESKACATCGHGVALTRRERSRRPVLLLALMALGLLGAAAWQAWQVSEDRKLALASMPVVERHSVKAAATAAEDAVRAEHVAALEAAERYVLRRLGVTFEEGRILRCFDVRAGTPADGELRKGDRIDSVEGVAIVDVLDLVTKLRGRPQGEVVRVGVTRGERMVYEDGSVSSAGEPETQVLQLELGPEPTESRG